MRIIDMEGKNQHTDPLKVEPGELALLVKTKDETYGWGYLYRGLPGGHPKFLTAVAHDAVEAFRGVLLENERLNGQIGAIEDFGPEIVERVVRVTIAPEDFVSLVERISKAVK
jgi:hypothetical protein